MALRLLVAHTPAERDAARQVEGRVFLQTFGNTADEMDREYGPYDVRSRFVTVMDDASGTAVGAARLIVSDAAAGPVKTLVDVSGAPWHLDPSKILGAAAPSGGPVWDVASLAVDRRFRSGASGAEVTVALCHGLIAYSLRCGVEGWVTVLDDRVLRLMHSMGIMWVPMPAATSQPYLGSTASTPCTIDVAGIPVSVRSLRPDLASTVADGVFRSIERDPADLAPHRGELLPEADPVPVRPPRTRRDTTGWRPPTERRAVAADPVA